MNELKEDSMTVLRILFNESQNKQTLNINMTYQQILQNIIDQGYTERFDIDKIKYSVEYLSGHHWVTYKNHPVFHDVCITSDGIDEYYHNFQ